MKKCTMNSVVMLIGFVCSGILQADCSSAFECNKIYKWGIDTFKQANQYSDDFIKKAKPFVQSTVVYHQFAKVVEFNALFLTDSIRMLYVDYSEKRRSTTREKESVTRQRLLNENKYYISFYIIGTQSENRYFSSRSLFSGEYRKYGNLLGDQDATWHVRLVIDGKEYIPNDIRGAELPAEYKVLFGSEYSQFKHTYLVRFDAMDEQERQILTEKSNDVKLLFRSAEFETDLSWCDIQYH